MARAVYGLGDGSLIGGYRIDRRIGEGGMGVVFAVTHIRLGRKAALKVMVPRLADDGEFRERFIRESRLAASIEHPNIIPIYDADEEDDILYLAMRYVEGVDLAKLLDQRGPLSLEEALAVVEPVAAALDAAHAAGLVHRDVKPANVLIEDNTRRVFLTDFGLAKTAGSTGVTRTGSFIGTPHYCSPEQINGTQVDGRSDVYSLGCLLFHCLAGQPPFPRDSDVGVIHAHLTASPPAVTTVRSDLPPFLDGVIATAMAKFPEVRYTSGRELISAIRAGTGVAGAIPALSPTQGAHGAAPTVAEPVHGKEYRARPPAATVPLRGPRKRWLVAAAAIVAAAASIAAVVFVIGAGSGDDHKTTSVLSPSPAQRVPQLIAGRLTSELIQPQRRLTGNVQSLRATGSSFQVMEGSARALRRSVLESQGWASGALIPSTKRESVDRRLFGAALATQSTYAKFIETLPTDPSRFTQRLANRAIELADRAEEAYARLSGADATLPRMPVHRSDHMHLLDIAVKPRPPEPKPPKTTPTGPEGTPRNSGVTSDIVAFSGGEGVRYRYSPYTADLVPGNGPFEGDPVTIYCYTTGETVKGNPYWAKVAVGPDRYVPATFLRYGHSGPPDGVALCPGTLPTQTRPPTVAPGANSDIVAFSGGEGVRYRYSPYTADLVPGNGPFEGDPVTIYCYTTGETVKGNPYWAKVAVGPDRYVPATFLRYGHSGPPAGANSC